MKVVKSKTVLVKIGDDKKHGILTEDTISKHRNSGIVIGKSDDISAIKIGDTVHFGDTSGAFYKDKTMIVLNEEEIIFIGETAEMFTGENLLFYISNTPDPEDRVCII